jgi:hypothetical protein
MVTKSDARVRESPRSSIIFTTDGVRWLRYAMVRIGRSLPVCRAETCLFPTMGPLQIPSRQGKRGGQGLRGCRISQAVPAQPLREIPDGMLGIYSVRILRTMGLIPPGSSAACRASGSGGRDTQVPFTCQNPPSVRAHRGWYSGRPSDDAPRARRAYARAPKVPQRKLPACEGGHATRGGQTVLCSLGTCACAAARWQNPNTAGTCDCRVDDRRDERTACACVCVVVCAYPENQVRCTSS